MRHSLPIAASLAAVALLASACGSTAGSGGGATSADGGKLKDLPAKSTIQVPADAVHAKGDGSGKCPPGTTIAYAGALSGPNMQLGINIVNGIQQAVDEHNKANKGCQVTLKKFDTEGDPAKAVGPVTQLIKDKSIIGVVGLPFSGESDATGDAFENAGLVHVTPAATLPDLTTRGWKTFKRGLGNDNVQGPAVATLADKLGAKKVYVVEDDSAYGQGLSKAAQKALGDKLAGTDKVTTGQKDFGSVVAKIMTAKPDAVFYSGYYAEGAPFDQQLVNKGFKGVFIGPDGVKDQAFIDQAGAASDNAYYTCACLPGELIPDFAKTYRSKFKMEPGTYSVEAYDATVVLLSGIDKGNTTRPKLLKWTTDYDAQGISKKLKWDKSGELAETPVFGYKTQDGKIVSVGLLD